MVTNILSYIKEFFMKNEKEHWFKLFLFCLLFVLFFLIYYYDCSITSDEIWNYGFAYNISQGLIPYLDFNMIQTALYSYLLGWLIYIFGNHFILMEIFNSFLSASLQYFLFKKYGYKTLLLFPCICFSNCSCYNFLSLLLLIILLNICENDNNEYLKGFISSLLVFAKQTTGGVLLIVSFIFSKKKKKFLVGFLPVCLLYLCYLLLTNSFYEFFDYCFFSLFDFTGGNAFSSTYMPTIIYIPLMILLIELNIKNRFKNRELLYILTFQFMSAPLFDFEHIIISSIPFLAYLLTIDYKEKWKKVLKIAVLTFFIFYTTSFPIFNESFIDSKAYYINNSFLDGKKITFNLQGVYSILDDVNNNYKHRKVYHLYHYAYLVKLVHNQTTNKYDMNLKGNMGYHGEDRCIEEIKENCSKQACLIIIDSEVRPGSQISAKINDYVRKNYKFNKQLYDIDFYTN